MAQAGIHGTPGMALAYLIVLITARHAAADTQPSAAPTKDQSSSQSSLSDGQAHEAGKQAFQSLLLGSSRSGTASSMSNVQRSSSGIGQQPMNPLQMILGGASSGGMRSYSVESMDVVSGLIEAFMHKVQLQSGEKTCLKNNIGAIVGDVMATILDAVAAIKTFINWKTASSRDKSDKLVAAGIDSALKLTSMVTMSTQLLRNCVHGDALDMLKKTGQHLVNGQYLQNRFLVNGVDIAHGLADSIVAFEAKDFRRFGRDIGVSLRKVLLSNARKGTRALPEGMPQQDIIQKVTQGLMRGFFIKGAGFVITDDADPDVNIVVNLHRCVAGNSMFFKEIWTGLWNLFAQLAANPQQFQLPSVQPAASSGPAVAAPQKIRAPKWQGELMVALLQFPMALQRCGLGADAQRMFMEAIQSIKYVHVKMIFPEDRIKVMKATDKMAKAVEAWTNWDFDTFGKEIGMLLRELVMLAFPQKYSVDANGRLKRQLVNLSQTNAAKGLFPGAQHSSLFIGVVGASVFSVFVSLVALRSMRITSGEFNDRRHVAYSRVNDHDSMLDEDVLYELEEAVDEDEVIE